ncbi:two-component system, chemotaxis family, response regulator CheB [Chitinophaga terrae (ex Kim and Jung 2007)]|uniref:protein-glutamate methylesterase n=1 Tax=Chitinophaga terrae (ex Kim and Jung 2007) TaxID=408074 RepID=A0A1H3Y8K7_9BACT|nr:chemotaxis protein CheB [Chitinophaga terrae (ex Kim and Jung 2007)]SEA07965.1 two-component system, chemotaxis family, response regulator CheB [Chitinophaga terrae (ex Kim and Jung 2007)]
MTSAPYLVVIGGSAGGLQPVLTLLPGLSTSLKVAVVIVLHRQSHHASVLTDLLATRTGLTVKEAEEKELIQAGTIYIAPADYHLLIESDRTFSLDDSEKVNFSRPSIDVTFSSAAYAYKSKVSALLLSGANADGVEGLIDIHQAGGTTVVQDPLTADVDYMPREAVRQAKIDLILQPEEMARFINTIAGV